MKLRVSDYNDNTTGIREAIASLRGCRREERPNEAMLLKRVLASHEGETLLRRDAVAVSRRTAMVERANAILTEVGEA